MTRGGIWASLLLLVVAGQITRGAAAEPRPLRVLSYNIHHGEGTDGKFDLPRLAKVITAAKPDLVALQEVDRKTRRSMIVDQAAELGRLTGMHAEFGKAMSYSGGEYGEAILSRMKPSGVKAHPLPFTPGNEPRCALEVRVRPDNLPELRFVATHLDHLDDPRDRLAQARELNKLFTGDPGAPPTILTGDLNAVPDSEPIKVLKEFWKDTAPADLGGTWPSDKPQQRIDYVLLLQPQRWRVVKVEVIDEQTASDHRPLLVELEYSPTP